jgi:hypothetical protein
MPAHRLEVVVHHEIGHVDAEVTPLHVGGAEVQARPDAGLDDLLERLREPIEEPRLPPNYRPFLTWLETDPGVECSLTNARQHRRMISPTRCGVRTAITFLGDRNSPITVGQDVDAAVSEPLEMILKPLWRQPPGALCRGRERCGRPSGGGILRGGWTARRLGHASSCCAGPARLRCGGWPSVRPRHRGVYYWPDGGYFAVFYDDLGQQVPPPGLVRLGVVDGGLDAIASAGTPVHGPDRPSRPHQLLTRHKPAALDRTPRSSN